MKPLSQIRDDIAVQWCENTDTPPDQKGKCIFDYTNGWNQAIEYTQSERELIKSLLMNETKSHDVTREQLSKLESEMGQYSQLQKRVKKSIEILEGLISFVENEGIGRAYDIRVYTGLNAIRKELTKDQGEK